MRKNILHYGLQRSGTNFLETLLNKNFDIKILNNNNDRKHPLQKHFRLYNNKIHIPEPQYKNNLIFNSFYDYEKLLGLRKPVDGIIIISKDPYSWYLSYTNWAKKCNWPKASYHYIEEYISFYGKWIEFSKDESRIIFIRYIDLLTDANNVLDRISGYYNLSLKLTRKIMGKSFNISKVSQSRTFSVDKLKYYLNKEYLDNICKTDLEYINSKLNTTIMNDLNYQIEKV